MTTLSAGDALETAKEIVLLAKELQDASKLPPNDTVIDLSLLLSRAKSLANRATDYCTKLNATVGKSGSEEELNVGEV